MPQTFYIFRHAMAVKKGEAYGDRILTATILPEGIPAIKRLGRYLNTHSTDYHVSSEVIRCRQTAEIVSTIIGKPFVYDKHLNEYYLETFDELEKRVRNFLDELHVSDFQTPVICTHGAVIAVLKNLIVSGQCSEENLNDFPDPGVLLVIASNQVSEHDFN